MVTKIRLAVQAAVEAAKKLKKYWPYIAAIIVILAFLPIMLVTTLFSWLGVIDSDDEEMMEKASQYKTLATAEGISWQHVFAVDLGWNEMDLDKIDPKKIIKEFIYYTEEEEDVYETVTKDGVTTTKKTGTRTIKVKRHYSYNQVMDNLNFTVEQREMTDSVLSVLMEQEMENGSIGVNDSVMAFEPLVRKYAEMYGVEDHISLLLALIQQESGGRVLDVMQSSESAGLPPNTFTNPEDSIQQGIKYFSQMLSRANNDIKLTLQSYNFGGGFIDYALSRGGYSKENAIAFSQMMAERLGWDRYGDINYVDNVLRYATGFITGDGDQIFSFSDVYQSMREYIGLPYVWGGRKPSDGGFDCSGLMEYVFAKYSINVSGTAENQYHKTVAVSESAAIPGDLVFFKTTEKEISHVGMYIGNGQFINSNNGGVEVSSLEGWRKLYPFKGFRRIQTRG